ncbi:hypothetical protein DXG01_002230, partial [Tephrocybe rancida]
LNSSIAQYVAQRRAQRGKLAASFFFNSARPKYASITYVVPTLALQLALSPLRGFRPHLAKALHEDPFINCRSFPTQVERLLLEPLRSVSATPPFLVVIDALDQCEGEENQREVLAQLARIVRAPRSPLRFIVTSTNAPHLHRAFDQPELKAVSSSAGVAANPTTVAEALSSYIRVYLPRELLPHHLPPLDPPHSSASSTDTHSCPHPPFPSYPPASSPPRLRLHVFRAASALQDEPCKLDGGSTLTNVE